MHTTAKTLTRKITIIGAGWYGCHLALTLKNLGHQVKIFEKEQDIFLGASKKNQNRLHLGFHYPRNYLTRVQSFEGFAWFIQRYGFLTRRCPNNIYAVAANDSIVDFRTYLEIMRSSGLKFDETKKIPVKLENIEGAISVDERIIKNDAASLFFKEKLSSSLVLGTRVNLDEPGASYELRSGSDLIIDCTWGTSKRNTSQILYFEPCIYFYYRCELRELFGLTIMDGHFFSIYPYSNEVYTITSVKHGPLGRYAQHPDALERIRSCDNDKFIGERRRIFENEIRFFYPNFLNDFTYESVEFSVKSKLESKSDFRGCLTKRSGNFIEVFSGKIDTLHIAEREVLNNLI